MSKKVLITGGAGFIGFNLAKSLSNQGHHVIIIDNFQRAAEDLEFKDFMKNGNSKFIKGDITKPEIFDNLNSEFDYIYHLAAINGTEYFYSIPDKVIKVDVLGTLNILDWFIKQKKGKLLYSSSSETYAGSLKLMKDKFPIPTPENIPLAIEDPSNVRWSYGASKILGEVAVHSYSKVYGIKDFVIIRYHNIYGPRMGFEHVIPQFIERIVKKENPFRVFGWEETRAFCYIDDAIRATQLVMESPKTNGSTVHIGKSDEEIKIIDLAKKLFDIASVNPSVDLQPSAPGCVKRRCPDISKLKNLGFKPEIELDDGLKRTYDWYKGKFN